MRRFTLIVKRTARRIWAWLQEGALLAEPEYERELDKPRGPKNKLTIDKNLGSGIKDIPNGDLYTINTGGGRLIAHTSRESLEAELVSLNQIGIDRVGITVYNRSFSCSAFTGINVGLSLSTRVDSPITLAPSGGEPRVSRKIESKGEIT